MGQKTRLSGAGTGSRQKLSHERGSVKKKWKNRLPIALVYPNTYPLGMSNLGFQLVYHLLNREDSIVAERVFLPEPGFKPLSVESNRPLGDFPLLFFSVSFEQDYQHLIMLLEMAGIPSLAADRTARSPDVNVLSSGGQPLVVAGGVATFMNPEPLAPFVDLFLIGEAEPLLPALLPYLDSGVLQRNRIDLLAEINTNLAGCYAPVLYDVTYDTAGRFLSNTPREEYHGLPQRIKKVVMDSPGPIAGHSTILTPQAEFSDLFMTELGRGCSRGCRFCAAGFIYRPPRLWPAQAIIQAIDSRPGEIKRVGLLGMEMASPADIASIAEYLSNQSCSLSFSSLRADTVSASLLELLGSSNLKSAAIAPDGGSERLRLVINKGITENDVLAASETLTERGIRNLKLYFMIGLPTETEDDLHEMAGLIMKVKKKILDIGRSRGSLSTLTLSINCFIPKPWTPFQFHPMAEVAVLKRKIKFLRKKIAGEPNIRLKTESPEKAFSQALLSRGDRQVGQALLCMLHNNCTWRRAFKLSGINPDDYTVRQREADEPFPWEIIDHGIDRKYLWAEYRKALQEKTTKACDTSRCKRCGVC